MLTAAAQCNQMVHIDAIWWSYKAVVPGHEWVSYALLCRRSKMEMTTPVFSTAGQRDAGMGQMSFPMESQYGTNVDALPEPQDQRCAPPGLAADALASALHSHTLECLVKCGGLMLCPITAAGLSARCRRVRLWRRSLSRACQPTGR